MRGGDSFLVNQHISIDVINHEYIHVMENFCSYFDKMKKLRLDLEFYDSSVVLQYVGLVGEVYEYEVMRAMCRKDFP